MADRYHSFSELARETLAGRDYTVRARRGRGSPVLILAPHGGRIEEGTSELALRIACRDHSLFMFEGLRPTGNRELHIGSTRFDHPQCLSMLARSALAIGIHGCRGEAQIYVGGLEQRLTGLIVAHLTLAGLPATASVPRHLAGRDPRNLCNRGTCGRGAQLEVTMDLRTSAAATHIASAVRASIAAYLSLPPVRLHGAFACDSFISTSTR
ncbi:MAG TPA: poly-gamma-glutamate hydrolase family protein [Steroidobacteraceae bacterium]|nr:poly-gamma-glutamate hydrolase family protein [Steroidobacteraceae bacterium]